MFRILYEHIYQDNKTYIEAAANSDDTLPEGNYVTGSNCLIVDTLDVKFFNEDADTGSKWGE